MAPTAYHVLLWGYGTGTSMVFRTILNQTGGESGQFWRRKWQTPVPEKKERKTKEEREEERERPLEASGGPL